MFAKTEGEKFLYKKQNLCYDKIKKGVDFIMKKLIAIILFTLILLTSCSKPDMTIKNATLIDTSEVHKISTLLDDKLTAYRYKGDKVFTRWKMGASGGPFFEVDQYIHEMGFIDCNNNSFTKVAEVLPVDDIGVDISPDRDYIYYTYNEYPKGTPYPETQKEHSAILYDTPTTVLQYNIKTGEMKTLSVESYAGHVYPMENETVLVNSFDYSSNDLPEKEYVTYLDFKNGTTKMLYSDNDQKELEYSLLKAGQRYIFVYSLRRNDITPFVKVIDTHDFSEKIIDVSDKIKDMEYPSVNNKEDTLFLYDDTYGNKNPLTYKLSPENDFEIVKGELSDIEEFHTYVSNTVGDEPGETRGKYFQIENFITGERTIFDIAIDGFVPAILHHGTSLYHTSGENYILFSGNDKIWDFYPVFNLQTDFKLYYVKGEEINRAMGK